MILRTPPQKKRRPESVAGDHVTPVSDRRLVLYNDPGPIISTEPSDEVVCTYHCRQMVKSEFMVALSTAEGQVLAYQTKLDAMNKELCESEDERKKSINRIHALEQELEASKGREHALQERMLKEVGDSMERYRGEVKQRNELEIKLKKEVESRKNAELSIASANELAKDLEGRLQRLSDSADRERTRLEREISHLQDESKLLASQMSADLEKLTLKAQNSAKESDLLKEQLVNLRKQLDASINQLSEAEHKLASYTALSHEGTSSDDKMLVKHLQSELKKYEAEVQEAKMLKASHVDGALLKEKLLEEKGCREKMELEISRLQEVELHAQKVELELISWKSLLKEIPDILCFSDIPKKFSALQKEAITNMMEVGEVKAHLKQLEVDLELVQHKKEDAEKKAMLNKDKANNASLEIKRLELMLSSATEERDRLRMEVTVLGKQKIGHLESGLATETPYKDLESSLAKREDTIRELEINLHEQQDLINRQHDELKLLNEKLGDESRRVKSLEREGDRLRSEISLLESKLGHGDYSVENTKVLRMVNTLSVDNETKHTIEALRDELKRTQEKLQALEELKGQSDAGIIIDAGIPEKLAQLKGQIAVLEKREERYKAVFAERISVFRRACCSLFGYKIVMDDQQRANGIPVTRFTLQSIYAQSDDEKLEFEYESGSTNIMVNDYSSQGEISHQIEIFIKKMNSIPAFTANLTMESFNKRTLC